MNFEVHDGITYSLYQYLLDGIIDISVARTPLRLDEVSYMELCSEPMIAVSAPKNMVSKTADVTTDTPHNSSKHNAVSSLKLSDLLHRPLILYRRYEELIMNTFHAQNMNPDIFCVCDDPEVPCCGRKKILQLPSFRSPWPACVTDFVYKNWMSRIL